MSLVADEAERRELLMESRRTALAAVDAADPSPRDIPPYRLELQLPSDVPAGEVPEAVPTLLASSLQRLRLLQEDNGREIASLGSPIHVGCFYESETAGLELPPEPLVRCMSSTGPFPLEFCVPGHTGRYSLRLLHIDSKGRFTAYSKPVRAAYARPSVLC
jgi:hypothetical protein